MDDANRIAELERRVTELERIVSGIPVVQPSPYLVGLPQMSRGCVCPPGTEALCPSAGCPRRGLGGARVTCRTDAGSAG